MTERLIDGIVKYNRSLEFNQHLGVVLDRIERYDMRSDEFNRVLGVIDTHTSNEDVALDCVLALADWYTGNVVDQRRYISWQVLKNSLDKGFLSAKIRRVISLSG